MGEIIISLDYGRRAEYLTSFVLSPYSITIPIRGHDDRVESDFLCIGFEKEGKYFIPNLKLIFWVQTKSQVAKSPRAVRISSQSKVESILNNKMPYFIAIVNTKKTPTISLYGTSERLALKHMYPTIKPKKIDFKPGLPSNNQMYPYDSSNGIATIYMGNPFLELKVEKNYERDESSWVVLKGRIEKEYRNFLYASVGLGLYEREPHPWTKPGDEIKIFYPTSGKLTKESWISIQTALQMLDLTLIAKVRKSNSNSDLVKAMDTIKKELFR
jgi:hypothetical protein